MNNGTLSVTKTMVTETAHRLMDYAGKCANIHGHSYRWEVTCECRGGLDVRGILIDFSDLKAAMKKAIYDSYDHALVLCASDPIYLGLDCARSHSGEKFCYLSNVEQKIVATPCNPTAENLAGIAAYDLQTEMRILSQYAPDAEDGDFFRITRVRVWETANSYAEWCRDSD